MLKEVGLGLESLKCLCFAVLLSSRIERRGNVDLLSWLILGLKWVFPFSDRVTFPQVICWEVTFVMVFGVRHPPTPTPASPAWVSAPCTWPPGLPSPTTALLTPASCVPLFMEGFLPFNTNQGLRHSLFLAPHGLPGKGKMSPTAVTHCPLAGWVPAPCPSL